MSIATDVNDSQSYTPLEVQLPPGVTRMDSISEDSHKELLTFLTGRLNHAKNYRDQRIDRYAMIDKAISTWQTHKDENVLRATIEEMTGRSQALPVNLPLLATHLEDSTAYYTEVFAPSSGAFYTSSGEQAEVDLAKAMNQDAASRDMYTQLALTFRSLLKYNVGGVFVEWEEEGDFESGIEAAGNRWTAIDVYNFFYDPTIDNLSQLSARGEFAARAEMVNRISLIKGALSGTYGRVNDVMESCGPKRETNGQTGRVVAGKNRVTYYREPVMAAGLPADGQDSKSRDSKGGQTANWSSMGLSMPSEGGIDIDGYERVTMYCWIRPNDFDLLDSVERDAMKKAGITLESFVELWKFVIIDGKVVVFAEPKKDRDKSIESSKVNAGVMFGGGNLPVFASTMTQDNMKQAGRSVMEYMRGFQRFASYLMNIYVAGMRKNIWGVKAYDPQMFDGSSLASGDVVGLLKSKMPGRDVRQGLMNLESNANVDQAITALGQTLDLVQNFFPSQSLPSQVAGIDRAVKSQVSAVMQGAQRRLHMGAKIIDSILMRPARMESFRNLRDFGDIDSQGDLKDELVARVIGSGLASLEAERILEILRDLLFTIIQNPESAAQYDVPGMLAFMSRVANMPVDLGRFAKQQNPAMNPPVAGGGAAPVGDASGGVDPTGAATMGGLPTG